MSDEEAAEFIPLHRVMTAEIKGPGFGVMQPTLVHGGAKARPVEGSTPAQVHPDIRFHVFTYHNDGKKPDSYKTYPMEYIYGTMDDPTHHIAARFKD